MGHGFGCPSAHDPHGASMSDTKPPANGGTTTEHGPHCDDWTEGDSPTPDPAHCQTCAFVQARQRRSRAG